MRILNINEYAKGIQIFYTWYIHKLLRKWKSKNVNKSWTRDYSKSLVYGCKAHDGWIIAECQS